MAVESTVNLLKLILKIFNSHADKSESTSVHALGSHFDDAAVSLCKHCSGINGRGTEQGGIIHVFLLAGQSNMQGQGVVDLDHPQYYNGGKGTLKSF